MLERRPASPTRQDPRKRALDVSSLLHIPLPLLWIMVLSIASFFQLSGAQARSLALVSPSSQTHNRALKRLRAELGKQLRALGVEVIGESIFADTARNLGLSSGEALHKESLPRICDSLHVDGVLILGQSRGGRLSAYLFGATGHLRLKRQARPRGATARGRWLRAVARLVDQRLEPARPPLEDAPQTMPALAAPAPALTSRSSAPAPAPSRQATDWQPAVELGVESLGTSNLYADASRLMDLAVHPWLDVGLDLSDDWALGYRGELRSWMRTDELLQHAHRAYAAKGFSWGKQAQHSLILLGDLSGSFNRQTYQALDFLHSRIQAALDVQALDWLALQASGSLGGRLFFHDSQSNSFDVGLAAGFDMHLPMGWRVGLQAQADVRLYTQSSAPVAEANDLQVAGELRLSGPLWRHAHLSAQAGYRQAIGDSHQVQRVLAESQIRALGDSFLSSGPRASLRATQQLGAHNQLAVGLSFEQNDYAGWPALDEQGLDMGRTRKDRRLGPLIAMAHGWSSGEGSSGLLPLDCSLRVEYGFVRQWSNGPYNDVAIHMLSLNMQAVW